MEESRGGVAGDVRFLALFRTESGTWFKKRPKAGTCKRFGTEAGTLTMTGAPIICQKLALVHVSGQKLAL